MEHPPHRGAARIAGLHPPMVLVTDVVPDAVPTPVPGVMTRLPTFLSNNNSFRPWTDPFADRDYITHTTIDSPDATGSVLHVHVHKFIPTLPPSLETEGDAVGHDPLSYRTRAERRQARKEEFDAGREILKRLRRNIDEMLEHSNKSTLGFGRHHLKEHAKIHKEWMLHLIRHERDHTGRADFSRYDDWRDPDLSPGDGVTIERAGSPMDMWEGKAVELVNPEDHIWKVWLYPGDPNLQVDERHYVLVEEADLQSYR